MDAASSLTNVPESKKSLSFIHSTLDDYPLTAQQFRVYCHVLRRAGERGCFETVPNMAKFVYLNPKTVRESLKFLTTNNMIVANFRPGKTTIYNCTSPKDWKKKQSQNLHNSPKEIQDHPSQLDTGNPSQMRPDKVSQNNGSPNEESKGSQMGQLQAANCHSLNENSNHKKISFVQLLQDEVFEDAWTDYKINFCKKKKEVFIRASLILHALEAGCSKEAIIEALECKFYNGMELVDLCKSYKGKNAERAE